MVLLPILPYILWQVFYLIKVQGTATHSLLPRGHPKMSFLTAYVAFTVISAKKVQEQDYQTTFRWFSSMDKGGIGKLIKKASPNWRLAAFVGTLPSRLLRTHVLLLSLAFNSTRFAFPRTGYQLLYTVVTMLPSILYLRYFWAHTILIGTLLRSPLRSPTPQLTCFRWQRACASCRLGTAPITTLRSSAPGSISSLVSYCAALLGCQGCIFVSPGTRSAL
jgi:hypothetical protein